MGCLQFLQYSKIVSSSFGSTGGKVEGITGGIDGSAGTSGL
jgi:hypothetical protein